MDDARARWWLRPVDGASLAAFRFLFGLTLAIGLVRFVERGWVRPIYGEPSFFFKFPGFSWVVAWPEWGMKLHFVVLALLAALVALGLFYRVAIVLFFLGFTYLQLIDVTNYLNHYVLVVLLAGLMIFLPLDRTWSLDALRRPERRRDHAPAYALYLVRFQIGIVYVFAAFAKLGTDWLLHAQPLNLWLLARTETPIVGAYFGLPWVAYVFAWGGFLYDATIVLWLSWARTRPFAYLAVLGFHFVTHVFFDIGMFPLIMVTSTLIFFPPSWPRDLARRLGLSAPVGPPPVFRGPPRAVVGLVAMYLVLQVLVPLRHYLYPGDVLWSEEGMRFAWKVMVREKNGALTYHVRRKRDGRRWQVNPRRYLTPRQANEMAAQPDLILQLAHHIHQDFARRGLGDVEVRAEAWVSLNGRPAALLLDPDVDLATVEDGLRPAPWIRPMPDRAPVLLGLAPGASP